jgi:hypothetical protein
MSHVIHPRILYCKICGCADCASARNRLNPTWDWEQLGLQRARRLFSQLNTSQRLSVSTSRHSRRTTSRCGPTPSDTYITKTHHSRRPQARKSAVVFSADRRTKALVKPPMSPSSSSLPAPVPRPRSSRDLVSARGRGNDEIGEIRDMVECRRPWKSKPALRQVG